MKLKTKLYSVDTLHVEVPKEISTEEFEELVAEYSDEVGYESLDETGLLIDANELDMVMGAITDEDEVMAQFFNQVKEVVGDADLIYFHRGASFHNNARGKR